MTGGLSDRHKIQMDFEVLDLGLVDYQMAWEIQAEFAGDIAAGRRAPTLLLLEHPHVYTFGRKGRYENLLLNEAQLKEKNIQVHWVDRGGDVTYHGPGQLVGYPIIPLVEFGHQSVTRSPLGGSQDGQDRQIIPKFETVGYVRDLEKMLIQALARLGLAAGTRPGMTGVWIQPDVWSRCTRCRPADRQKPAKLAAIGVKVDARGITRHGFALNVEPDMTYWQGIIACGLQDEPVASLADLLIPIPHMNKVKQEVIRAFADVFFSRQ